MKKTAVFFAIFLFFTGMAYSQQENIFRHPLMPQTEPSFRLTCRRLSERPLIRGTFEQEKIISRLNRSLKSSGNFIIAAGLGMVWNTLNPFPSTLVLGKDFIIQSRPGGQRTVLCAQGNETFLHMADVISTVFTGNAQGLIDNFEVYYYERGASWELALIPLDKALNSFANMITMNGDTVIRSIRITEQNNDSITYILSNHTFPEVLNANENALFSLP
jgi:outer membrane lipoprotein-sorting protein